MESTGIAWLPLGALVRCGDVDMEALEARIFELMQRMRAAKAAGDHAAYRALGAELRKARRMWDEGMEESAPAPPAAKVRLLPVREQVHQALTLLGVPAAAKMIVAVHEAFFAGRMTSAQLTSIRRDEERSFRSAPGARPYYLCAALTAELLSPARGLLAVSTWPLPARMIGPLSSRTDFLVAAVRIAEHLTRLTDAGETASTAARRLLTRLAQNIPGAVDGFGPAEPAKVIAAARAELVVHQEKDRLDREAAAARAARRLDPAAQLFGARLKTVRSA